MINFSCYIYINNHLLFVYFSSNFTQPPSSHYDTDNADLYIKSSKELDEAYHNKLLHEAEDGRSSLELLFEKAGFEPSSNRQKVTNNAGAMTRAHSTRKQDFVRTQPLSDDESFIPNAQSDVHLRGCGVL